MFYCFNIVATTERRVSYNLEHYNLFLGVKDLFFQISKKVMFGNYRFVTTKNILKSHHRIYISMLTSMPFQSQTAEGRKEL